MLEFVLGILAATFAFIVSHYIKQYLHHKYIEDVMRPDEKVASYDATILITDDGKFSGWIDNKREIKIGKK